MDDKRYIGVDLGGWYSNNTSIAISAVIDDRLTLISLIKEPKIDDPIKKNNTLVQTLIKSSNKNAIIGIDAPFAIPAKLKGNSENYYELDKKYSHLKQLKNPYLYDNSARFVYNKTNLQVLAPTSSYIGAITVRMVDITQRFGKDLAICKSPYLNDNFATIEVYPKATLKIILNDIPKYKGKNFNKDAILNRLKDFIYINNSLHQKINTDHDIDAIICAISTYLINKNGFIKPSRGDLDKFSNSFIFLPNSFI